MSISNKVSEIYRLYKNKIITKEEMFETIQVLSKNVADDEDYGCLKFSLCIVDDVVGYEVAEKECDDYDFDDDWLTIPSKYKELPVLRIADDAFMWVNPKNISLPFSLRVIGDHAFCSCSELSWISIPSSVTDIKYGAFEGCALTSITIPEGIECINMEVFSGCDRLRTVNFPKSLTCISFMAFYGCSSLRQLILPPKVDTIEDGAFSRCINLEKISLPQTLTEIQQHAFDRCESLREINFAGKYEEWCRIEKGNEWNRDMPDCTLICSDKTVRMAPNERYYGTQKWADTMNAVAAHPLIHYEPIFTDEKEETDDYEDVGFLGRKPYVGENLTSKNVIIKSISGVRSEGVVIQHTDDTLTVQILKGNKSGQTVKYSFSTCVKGNMIFVL